MTPESRHIAWYVAAVVGISAVGVAGVVALEVLQPNVDRGLIVTIIGFLTPTVVALLALIRGEGNSQQIARVAEHAEKAAAEAKDARQITADAKHELEKNTLLTETVVEKIDKAVGQ